MKMGKAAKKLKIAEPEPFTCPECGGHELNLIKTNQIWVQPVEIVDGKLEYGPMDAVDDPDSVEGSDWEFRCRNCGYAITNEDGQPIGDTEDLIEWCKNPVVDED